MSVYQSTCERIICSPFVSGITAILSAVYFITYPSLSSAIVTSFIVKGLDVLQKVLRKHDIERFKGFPCSVVDEDEELEEQPVGEQPEEEQPEEEQPEEEQPEEEQPEEEQPEEEQPEEEDQANDEREEDEEYIPSHKSTLKRRTYNLRNRMD